MADSIVYEHESIAWDYEGGFSDPYKLVQFNGKTISISLTNKINNNLNAPGPGIEPSTQNYLEIKNLDNQKILKLTSIANKFKHSYTSSLQVFMYSESVLWIGLNGMDNYYGIWICDLVKVKLVKYFGLKNCPQIKQILPVGQKYFMMRPHKTILDGIKVFAWSNLLHVNNLDEPVYIMQSADERVYPIDWSASSIEHFKSIAFVRIRTSSEQLDFLDGNFLPVITLDVRDMFPNYEPIGDETPGIGYQIQKKVTVNANCLLYLEYYPKKPNENFPNTSFNNVNCYCWDFTTNSQVKFYNYFSKCEKYDVVAFHSPNTSSTRVKYLLTQHNYPKAWCKIFEPIG